ncbi:MAG: hypothetical protein BWX72_01108 [Firmicutes bacterium ADurb.Bin080]|jgi:hypothetical protein|nr:hypothetical protein [Clostridiales bacterium]OQC14989.1 MAG: hypothetical protein BWX72_01108 [Firmicutes bacterium ADurb.Bin080]
MRKLLLIIIFIIFLVSAAIFSGCKPSENTETFDVDINLTAIEKPTTLPEYSLEIEWFDSNGDTTSFVKNKPVMILFNGYSEYSRKESLTLPEDMYGPSSTVVSSAISSSLKRNLSYYWKKLVPQFNVGVFHYENFADDDLDNLNSKIYQSSACSYKIGDEVISPVDFNLTEAFFFAWKKIIDQNLLTGSDGMSILEVRFIGNSVGSNLAISCADYLFAASEQGLISSSYVPNRLTLTNPWFSNDEDSSTTVDFRKDVRIETALKYNEKRIGELSENGVVFEIIEGDPNYYKSYSNKYDGCTELVFGESTKLVWEKGEDTDLYDSIKSKSAYLTFTETFSNQYSDAYKKYDRAVLDWYLYSAGGSDSSSITTLRAGFKPVYDSWGHPSVTHNSYTESTTNGYSMKYGISAWTPTIYIRAVRGIEYSMKIYNSAGSTDNVMTKFQSEARQMSNMTMENGFFVCGYIYQSDISSSFVDLRPGKGLSGYTFSIVATPDEEYSTTEQIFTITTEKDGFYKCLLNEDLYACNIKINLVAPSPNHQFYPEDDIKTGNVWELSDENSIGRNGISASMYGTENSNFYIMIRNCGFLIQE